MMIALIWGFYVNMMKSAYVNWSLTQPIWKVGFINPQGDFIRLSVAIIIWIILRLKLRLSNLKGFAILYNMDTYATNLKFLLALQFIMQECGKSLVFLWSEREDNFDCQAVLSFHLLTKAIWNAVKIFPLPQLKTDVIHRFFYFDILNENVLYFYRKTYQKHLKFSKKFYKIATKYWEFWLT